MEQSRERHASSPTESRSITREQFLEKNNSEQGG